MFTQLGQIPYVILFLITGIAVFLLAFSLVPDQRRRQAEEALGMQGVDSGRVSPLISALRPLLRLLVPAVQNIDVKKYREGIEKRFVTAGMTGAMTTDEFLAYKVAMTVFFWVLFMGFAVYTLFHADPPVIVNLVVLGVGFMFPDLWLNGEVARRQDAIRRAFPYVMDLLTLSVEAGLDFVAGLHKVCEKAAPGPLIDELSFFQREIQLGSSRQQALRNLSIRCNMPEMSSFSALLIQADILGASVGPVLRAQSDLIRTQRFQRAERQGALASQKLLFPLILCIMPAVFIVIFGPVVLNFLLGGGVLGAGA